MSNQIVKRWFSLAISEIEVNHDYIIHKNLESLYSSLLNIKTKRLIILDIEDHLSIEYLKNISMQFDNINAIAIGTSRPIEGLITFFSIGFKGFIDLNYSPIELFQIINKVLAGSKYLSISQQEQLLNYLTENSVSIIENSLFSKTNSSIKYAIKALTEKEKRVCEFLIMGMSYKEIAGAIGVTSFTINQRVKNIYKKLKVKSRGELSFRYLG